MIDDLKACHLGYPAFSGFAEDVISNLMQAITFAARVGRVFRGAWSRTHNPDSHQALLSPEKLRMLYASFASAHSARRLCPSPRRTLPSLCMPNFLLFSLDIPDGTGYNPARPHHGQAHRRNGRPLGGASAVSQFLITTAQQKRDAGPSARARHGALFASRDAVD